MGILDLSFGAIGSGVLAWALVALWIRVSVRMKILDVPNQRSSHARVTPRGGGVAIVAAVLAFAGIAFATGRAGDPEGALWAGGLALFIAVISFVDDVRSLPSLVRLVAQVGAAVVAVRVLGSFPTVILPFLEPLVLPGWVMPALTVVWIVGLTNVYNFMDGIDGIAGGQGVVAGLAWAWFGTAHGIPLVAWVGVVLAAACLGFLVHNWSPAKVFMGDVGSAFLGFCFALLPLLALRGRAPAVDGSLESAGAVPIFAALAVFPFIGDGAITFLRRLRHRENVLAAHRSHLYQRLNIAGWGHAAISRLYVWWAVAAGLGGALYLEGGDGVRTAIFGLAAVSLGAAYALVKREESGREPLAAGRG